MSARLVRFSACAALGIGSIVAVIAQSSAQNARPDARNNSLSTHPVLPCTVTLPAAGTISTVAGAGYAGLSGIPGPATKADLFAPLSGAFDGAGNFYFPDVGGEVILKLDACSGLLSVIAGTGVGGYSGDGGPATLATFNHPYAVALGPSGTLYVDDSRNNVIRKIDPATQIVTTVIGTARNAGPGNADPCGPLTASGGKATATAICNATGMVVDANENIYFVNSGGQIVEASASSGTLTIIGGAGYGYTGDNGPAVSAKFSYILALALDETGNLYVADAGNCAIRKINLASGIVTSVVGVPASLYSGVCGLSGDGGPASLAQIQHPFGVAFDKTGNLYIADQSNNLIRVIARSNGNMYTIAGEYSGTQPKFGYSGDGGPANQALLFGPQGLSIDASGNLYIDDSQNYAVRKIADAASLIP